MGAEESNVFTANEITAEEGDEKKIFESNYPEITFGKQFNSSLFSQVKYTIDKKFILSSNSIVDVLLDPITLTSQTNTDDTWKNVILPLFIANDENKSYYQRLLNEYSRFLAERSNTGFGVEDLRREQRTQRAEEEIGRIAQIHTFISLSDDVNRQPNIQLDESFTLERLVSKLSNLNAIRYFPSANLQDYNESVLTILETTNSTKDLLYAVIYGFWAADINIILSAFTRAISFALIRNTISIKDQYISTLYKMPQLLDLRISVPFCDSSSFYTSTIIKEIRPVKDIGNSLSCDGSFIYIRDNDGYYQIQISKNVCPDATRVYKRQLNVKEGTLDNVLPVDGEIYVLTTTQELFLVNKTSDDLIPVKTREPINKNCCTDGHLIYSVKKRTVNIFEFNPQTKEFVVVRTLTLHKNGKSWEGESKDHIPESPNLCIFTNGIVLTARFNPPDKPYYIDRSFSLIDGGLIFSNKVNDNSAWAVTVDPANKAIWGVTPSKAGMGLRKYRYEGPAGPQFTGLDLGTIPTYNDIKVPRSITAADLASFLDSFFEYSTAHINGSSFNASLTMGYSYMVETSLFFGPSMAFINTLIESIHFFRQIIKGRQGEGQWNTPKFQNVLKMLFRLLDFNIASFKKRVINGQIVSLENEKMNQLVKLMIDLFNDSSMVFLKQSIAFTFINSFESLTTANPGLSAQLLGHIMEFCNIDFQFFMFKQISECKIFPYAFTSVTIRRGFQKLIKAIGTGTGNIKTVEIVDIVMASIIYELRNVYASTAAQLNPDQTQLLDSFQTFSSLLIEQAISNPQSMSVKFIVIFRKYLMLMKSFTKYNRAAIFMVSMIHPLYISIGSMITRVCGEGPKDYTDFANRWALLFDIHTLYADIIDSLLCGGTELNTAKDYMWLVSSTVSSGLKPKHIDKLIPDCFQGKSSGSLKRGLSFRCIGSMSSIDVQGAEIIISDLIKTEPPEYISGLMDYIYKKVPNPLNKRLSDEEKHVERIELAAFVKQLGLINIIKGILDSLKKKEVPVMSNLIKQCMDAIYKIRRTLRSIKQTSNALDIKSKETNVDLTSKSVMKNYGLFIETLKKKCVFLIHIEPCNRFVHNEEVGVFTQMIKYVLLFLSSGITLEDFFGILETASKVRMNVNMGINMVTQVIKANAVPIGTINFIDKFANSQSIANYFETSVVPGSDPKKIPGYDSAISLLYTVRDLIPKQEVGNIEILILAFFNLINAVSVIDAEIIPDLLVDYIKMIKGITFLPESYTAFGISYLPVFISKHPEFKNNKKILELVNLTCGEQTPIDIRYSIRRMVSRSGIDLDDNSDARSVFDMMLKAQPNLYHDMAGLLLEYLSKYDKKLELLHDILEVISDIAAGNPKHFLEEYPLLHEPGAKDSRLIRTAGILMSGCSELIEVIRRILDSKNEMTTIVKDVFAYILITQSTTNKGRTLPTREGLEIFNNSHLLYGVFAILSNVIETPRLSSLIKDVSSNKIYYVNSFIPNMNSFHLYSLPITKDVIPCIIKLSDSLHGISVIPFNPQLFPDYSLLMPFFKQYYQKSQSTYINEGLAFYVMSCMKEFISSLDFLKQFKQEIKTINIPSITYKSSLLMFQKVLRSHLYNKENGFLTTPKNQIEFMYSTPCDLYNPKQFELSKDYIESREGINYFMTPPLPRNKRTFFKFQFMTRESHVFVGLMTLSTSERVEESLLAMACKDEIAVLSKENIPVDCDGFMIQYDPLQHKATIYSCNNEPIDSMLFYNDQIVLYAAFYGAGSISYSIQDEIKTLPKENLVQNIPMAGIVFKKKNHFIKSLDEMKNQTVVPQIDPSDILSTMIPMKEKFMDAFNNYNPYQGLLWYDGDTLKQASTDLIILRANSIAMSDPIFQPITFEHMNIHRSNTTYEGNLYLTGTVDSVVDTVTNPNDKIVVDDMTGKVVKIDPSNETAFTLIKECTQINPLWTGILPSELLNFFETGYANRMRIELANQMLISALSIPSLQIEDIMHTFELDYVGLLHHFLSLLVFGERIIPSILINYDENLLDKHLPPRKAELHPIKNAINRILEHIAATDNIPAFADLWFNEVCRRFKDAHFHSVLDGHPSAVVLKAVDIADGIVLHRPDISAWFVLRAEHQSSGIVVGFYKTEKGEVSIDNTVHIVRSTTLRLRGNLNSDGIIVAIPFSKHSNESMFGTFIDLAITFKYLVRYLKENEAAIGNERFVQYKGTIYSLFFDSILARSPYFNTFGINALQYLNNLLPPFGYDLNGVFLQRINFIAKFIISMNEKMRNTHLGKWLFRMQDLWDERVLLPLKAHFPEFCTQSEIEQSESFKSDRIGLPTPPIPWSVNKEMEKNEMNLLVERISRMFAPRDTIAGWPFFNVIHFWANAAINLPFCNLSIIKQNILKVDFTGSIPDTFTVRFVGSQYNGDMTYSYNENMSGSIKAVKNLINSNKNKIVYIQIDVDWHSLEYFIWSDRKTNPTEEIELNRDKFVSDVKMMFTRWAPRNDTTILQCFQQSMIESAKLDFNYDPIVLFNPRLSGISMPLLVMRANMLLLVNWLVVNHIIDPAQSNELRHLNQYISIRLKVNNFLSLVVSDYSSASLKVNRQPAHDLRDGVSRNFTNSFIAQITPKIIPSRLRMKTDRPWNVEFIGEAGIDVGGPARELVTECAEDFMSPNCGLVVPTPNAVNNVGAYTDCFIPFANPTIVKPDKLYRTAGAIIGMCMRTGLVQEFQFPPLVWEYFVTNEITIDAIYEIDRNYKLLVESIREALAQGVSEEKFREQFNLTFVVRSVSGHEHALTQRGRQTPVTPANAEEYIANANQFRISELKPALYALREGLWENLGCRPQASLDPAVLEFAACGDKEISFEQLKEITYFNGVAQDQQQIFFKVIKNLTPEQRSALLKFTTGRIRLPPSSSRGGMRFNVDCAGAIDSLPTASTCFHQLHMPRYTSYQNALRMISIAIEFSGTFERA